MKFAVIAALLLISVRSPCWAQADQQEVRHHGMMHAMDLQRRVSTTARLHVSNNLAERELTVRIGPVSLSPHAGLTTVAQAPVFFLKIPFNGWLIAYHPRLTNARGQLLDGKLLHHAAIYNTARPDLLCMNKEERIFSTAGEMTDWPAIPGFGYHVKKDDRIRISTMFANPTSRRYPQVFFEVRIDYRIAQPTAAGVINPLQDVYPVWFNVMKCGNSGYELPPGQSTKTAQFRLRYSGRLLGAGGQLRSFGEWLVLKDATTGETIASLEPNPGAPDRALARPIDLFTGHGGYPVRRGDTITVTDAYNNPTGKSAPDGGRGVVVGYFLPDNDSELAALRRTPAR